MKNIVRNYRDKEERYEVAAEHHEPKEKLIVRAVGNDWLEDPASVNSARFQCYCGSNEQNHSKAQYHPSNEIDA